MDEKLRLVVMSEIVANEEIPVASADPRAAAMLAEPLVSEEHDAIDGDHPRASSCTAPGRASCGLPRGWATRSPARQRMARQHGVVPDMGRLPSPPRCRRARNCAWQVRRLRLVRASGRGPRLIDQVVGALAAAKLTGWDGLLAEQREFLDDFWEGADVEVDGDVEIQQAVRFGLFHILQAGARAENRPIPAKGLTGTGYDGHTFWDTETFVLPVLTYTGRRPRPTRCAGGAMTLDIAKEHAARARP